ncbi:MAG: helix-turn-helix transcriptional regulator [Acidiferrobacteraceae bacterium]
MTTRHKRLEPIYPGEILLEDFMKPMSIRINRLARDLVVPPQSASAPSSMASAPLRPTHGPAPWQVSGVSPQTWMGLQAEYDLRVAQRTIGAENVFIGMPPNAETVASQTRGRE